MYMYARVQRNNTAHARSRSNRYMLTCDDFPRGIHKVQFAFTPLESATHPPL